MTDERPHCTTCSHGRVPPQLSNAKQCIRCALAGLEANRRAAREAASTYARDSRMHED